MARPGLPLRHLLLHRGAPAPLASPSSSHRPNPSSLDPSPPPRPVARSCRKRSGPSRDRAPYSLLALPSPARRQRPPTRCCSRRSGGTRCVAIRRTSQRGRRHRPGWCIYHGRTYPPPLPSPLPPRHYAVRLTLALAPSSSSNSFLRVFRPDLGAFLVFLTPAPLPTAALPPQANAAIGPKPSCCSCKVRARTPIRERTAPGCPPDRRPRVAVCAEDH